MFNVLFDLLLFVCDILLDILLAVLAYNSAHYVWSCILSGCAGAMLVIATLELINRN